MATKEAALGSCAAAFRRNPTVSYAVYRVAGEWMYTSRLLEETRRHYKVPVRDFQIVHHAGGDTLEEHF